MIPWWQHRIHAEAITAPDLPADEWVPRGEQRLDDSTVDRLALALHDRWCGDATPEKGKKECARLSGAYDDVYVLEPLIVELLRGAS